jgi:hypothetical protein
MKEVASAAAVAITVFGTAPYALAMLRGRVRPHAFTWLVWTVTTFVAFVGQLVGGGGGGAAAAGASAGVGALVCGYSFWRGDRTYTRLDWLCLAGSGLALLAWAFAGGPLTAVVLIAVVDALGAVPTIRKARVAPHEEGVSPFVLANVKWLLAIYALERRSALTLVFPVTTTVVNLAIIAVVLAGRQRSSSASPTSSPSGPRT